MARTGPLKFEHITETQWEAIRAIYLGQVTYSYTEGRYYGALSPTIRFLEKHRLIRPYPRKTGHVATIELSKRGLDFYEQAHGKGEAK